MTEVVKAGSTDLAIHEEQQSFTPEQVAALQHIGVENASDGDLKVFFHQVKRTGLDPFARQLYMIGRNTKQYNPRTKKEEWITKQTIQTGIDGFRLIARRAVAKSGETLGYEDTLFCDQNGNWHEVVPRGVVPLAAKVIVLRNGQRFPAVAQYEEYVGTTRNGEPTQMWKSKPGVMLAKCAEALALRKAFPQDLSGLYTSDEMQEPDAPAQQPQPAQQQSRAQHVREPAQGDLAERVAPVQEPQEAVEYISEEQWAAIQEHLEGMGVTEPADKGAWVQEFLDRKIGSPFQITRSEAERMFTELSKEKAA